MPRKPRFNVANVPQLVFQRGHNGEPVFNTENDYRNYLAALFDSAIESDCDLHAYVLAPNYVKVLCTPRQADAVAKLMQAVGRRYVPYFNQAHGRSGTLWAGRYKACLVEPNSFVVLAHLFVETSPVRHGFVRSALEYPWSSAKSNASGQPGWPLVMHPMFQRLADTRGERAGQYRGLFNIQWNPKLLEDMAQALNHCLVVGSESFKDRIAQQSGTRVRLGKPGRPRKCVDEKVMAVGVASVEDELVGAAA